MAARVLSLPKLDITTTRNISYREILNVSVGGGGGGKEREKEQTIWGKRECVREREREREVEQARKGKRECVRESERDRESEQERERENGGTIVSECYLTNLDVTVTLTRRNVTRSRRHVSA